MRETHEQLTWTWVKSLPGAERVTVRDSLGALAERNGVGGVWVSSLARLAFLPEEVVSEQAATCRLDRLAAGLTLLAGCRTMLTDELRHLAHEKSEVLDSSGALLADPALRAVLNRKIEEKARQRLRSRLPAAAGSPDPLGHARSLLPALSVEIAERAVGSIWVDHLLGSPADWEGRLDDSWRKAEAARERWNRWFPAVAPDLRNEHKRAKFDKQVAAMPAVRRDTVRDWVKDAVDPGRRAPDRIVPTSAEQAEQLLAAEIERVCQPLGLADDHARWQLKLAELLLDGRRQPPQHPAGDCALSTDDCFHRLRPQTWQASSSRTLGGWDLALLVSRVLCAHQWTVWDSALVRYVFGSAAEYFTSRLDFGQLAAADAAELCPAGWVAHRGPGEDQSLDPAELVELTTQAVVTGLRREERLASLVGRDLPELNRWVTVLLHQCRGRLLARPERPARAYHPGGAGADGYEPEMEMDVQHVVASGHGGDGLLELEAVEDRVDAEANAAATARSRRGRPVTLGGGDERSQAGANARGRAAWETVSWRLVEDMHEQEHGGPVALSPRYLNTDWPALLSYRPESLLREHRLELARAAARTVFWGGLRIGRGSADEPGVSPLLAAGAADAAEFLAWVRVQLEDGRELADDAGTVDGRRLTADGWWVLKLWLEEARERVYMRRPGGTPDDERNRWRNNEGALRVALETVLPRLIIRHRLGDRWHELGLED